MARRSPDGLYKRGSIWWGWRRGFPGGPVERASTKCRDRKAARLVAAEWERNAADPVHYASNKTTLGEGITMFLADARRKGLAPPTLEMYASKCRHIARVLGQDRPMRSIVATTWDGYISTREAEGASSHSVKKELIRGFGVLKAAKRRGLYPHDLSTVMPTYAARYVPRTRALTMDELQRLGRELRPDRLAHVAFVVATGCRLKESYRATAAHLLDEGFVFLDGTKTKRARRTIPIAPPLRPFLEFAIANAPGAQGDNHATEEQAGPGHRDRQGRGAGDSGKGHQGRGRGNKEATQHAAHQEGDSGAAERLVWAADERDRDGAGLRGQARQLHQAVALFPKWHSARRDIHMACRRAGIAPCSWNDLRRSNATLLNHAGMTSMDIGRLLGHVDGRMVETVYGQSTPESLQRSLEAAFPDSTAGAHVDIVPRALPAKKAESATEKPGLRSRRSPVRIRGGAPEIHDSSAKARGQSSAEPAGLAGLPATSSTASENATEGVGRVNSPRQFPISLAGGGSEEPALSCDDDAELDSPPFPSPTATPKPKAFSRFRFLARSVTLAPDWRARLPAGVTLADVLADLAPRAVGR